MSSRPEQAAQYKDTENNISDSIEVEKYRSKGISEEKMKEMAKELKEGKNLDKGKYGLKTEKFIKFKDIMRESGKAAMHAAVITAVLRTFPKLYKCIEKYMKTGSVNREDIKEVGLSALKGSIEGSMRGSLSASIIISCKSGLFGDALKNVSPSVVGISTVVAMNAIHNLIGLVNGKMTEEEFANACMRDIIVAGMGIGGATLFKTIIPIPVLGVLLGNFIGSMVGSFAHKNINNIMVSFFIKKGYSFFKVVTQDYKLPAETLEKIGIDTISFEEITYKKMYLMKKYHMIILIWTC